MINSLTRNKLKLLIIVLTNAFALLPYVQWDITEKAYLQWKSKYFKYMFNSLYFFLTMQKLYVILDEASL